ncbi:MAG: glycosyltransferase [Desulfamplus sp.]|nr:glycosyltransferase [Desulfamplus sp.]
MKILCVNWAPLWRGAEVGGGVNIYSQSMAVKLVEFGHSVFSISAGFAYDFKNRAYIKKGPDFMGVKNYEIFNAPNIAPGFFNYENPMQDVSEPVIENLFLQFIKHIKPDVIHFHNIEGFSANCIKLAAEHGCRVIFSLHNYHPVCNQIYLLYKDRDICEDYNNGCKCLSCIEPPPYSKEIMKRRLAFHINKLPLGDRIWSRAQRISGLITGLNATKKTIFFLKSLSQGKQNNLRKDENTPDNSHQLYTRLLYDSTHKDESSDKDDNSHKDDSRYKMYARRRKLIIQSINHSHMIHAVSDFVKDFYIGKGIKAELITTCHIGNKMAQIAAENVAAKSKNTKNIKTDSSDLYFNKTTNKKTPDRPLHIIFLGISSQPKGLPFLLKTLLSMDESDNEVLKQISLHIHARGVWGLSHLINPLSKKMHAIESHDGYDFNNLPNILSGMNYGIVPPLWYDNAPQVVFEMMAMKIPVIGANIGGISDFVKNMDNGILFNPGDQSDLAEKIKMVVNDRELEFKLRKNIMPMKTPDQHAYELQQFYSLGS